MALVQLKCVCHKASILEYKRVNTSENQTKKMATTRTTNTNQIPNTMKTLKAIMAIGLSLTTSSFADDLKAKALKIDTLYKSGLVAMHQGKETEARTAFNEVLKLQPGHGHARYQLTQLAATIAKVQQQKREALFAATIIKEINFNNATLAEALEALDLFAMEATDKKFTPNFVVQDPSGQLAEKTVTLKMNNVPLSGILKYVTELTGTSIRYDAHATVFRPAAK